MKDGARQDMCAIRLLQEVHARQPGLGVLHARDRCLSRPHPVRVDERRVCDVHGRLPFLRVQRRANLVEDAGELGVRHARGSHGGLERDFPRVYPVWGVH